MSTSYSGFKILMIVQQHADKFMPMLRGLKNVLAVRRVKGVVGEVHVAFDQPVSEEVWDNHFVSLLSALLLSYNIEPIEWDFSRFSLPVDLELQKYVNELKSQANAEIQNVDEWAYRQRQLAYASRTLVKAFDPERLVREQVREDINGRAASA